MNAFGSQLILFEDHHPSIVATTAPPRTIVFHASGSSDPLAFWRQVRRVALQQGNEKIADFARQTICRGFADHHEQEGTTDMSPEGHLSQITQETPPCHPPVRPGRDVLCLGGRFARADLQFAENFPRSPHLSSARGAEAPIGCIIPPQTLPTIAFEEVRTTAHLQYPQVSSSESWDCWLAPGSRPSRQTEAWQDSCG